MAVELVAGSVIAHRGSGVGVAGGDLDVAEVDAGIEHGGDGGVAEHVRMDRRHPHTGGLSEDAKPTGGGVPVHASATGVEQEWPGVTSADRLVESAADSRWKWNEDRLAAFAEDAQNAVAMFFAEIGDGETGGFEDAQAQQPE